MSVDVAPMWRVFSGSELERGIIISHGTAFFAHWVLQIQKDMPGSILSSPQFGLLNEESDFTAPTFWVGNLPALSKFAEGSCEGEKIAKLGTM